MTDKNAPMPIEAIHAASRLSCWPVVLFLPARLVLAFLAQGYRQITDSMDSLANSYRKVYFPHVQP